MYMTNFQEIITSRVKNAELAYNLLMNSSIKNDYPELIDNFKSISIKYPEQRIGQIFCNFLCADYMESNPCEETIYLMGTLFNDNKDPFYEESDVTIRRWMNLDIFKRI